jgi:hypothetical protein
VFKYPETGTERDLTRLQRHRMRAAEAAALGDPRKIVDPPVTPEDSRMMHGRMIRPGVRPLLPVSTENRFAPFLTERQRRRGKVRTARSWGRMLAVMKSTGMTLEEFVETLSPEELVSGKIKDREGKFRGRPPEWVPREFHRACIRELMRRGKTLWQENYLQAIEAMTAIATGQIPGVKPGDRLRAAQYVIERIEGKIPDRLQIVDDSPWQTIIEDIVAEVPEETLIRAKAARNELGSAVQQEIIDAEILDEEPQPAPRRAAARRRRS